MRITHRVPVREPEPVILDPRYAAEVERATHRAERAYAKAQRDLASAQQRLERAQQARIRNQKTIKLATALVELRRTQLEELEAIMHASPAAATHRGRKSYRPVPTTRGSNL